LTEFTEKSLRYREQADQIILDIIEGAIYGPWTVDIRGD